MLAASSGPRPKIKIKVPDKRTALFWSEVVKFAKPPPKITVTQWAEEKRILSRKDSARPGRWKTEPHQKKVTDAFTDPKVRKVVLMAASQWAGKSQMMLNGVGYWVDIDPANMMIVHPSLDAAEKWAKSRLDPMIQATKALHGKISVRRSRDGESTTLHRQFTGGQMFIVGANVPADLAAQAVRILIADEVDRFELEAGDEGDPLDLAAQRTETYGLFAKSIEASTPGMGHKSRIYVSFLESDQNYFNIRCQGCKELFYPDQDSLVYEETNKRVIPTTVFCVCPKCGYMHDERERKRACREGDYVPRAPFEGIAGFHVNAMGCVRASMLRIAQRMVRAKGNEKREKVVINTVWAWPYFPPGQAPDWQVLYNRREPYSLGEVPAGVAVLTASTDVQRSWLETDVWGHGANGETWLVDHQYFEGNPLQSEVWDAWENYRTQGFKHPSGKTLYIEKHALDTGDGSLTNEIYNRLRINTTDPSLMGTKGSRRKDRTAPVTGPAFVDLTVGGKKYTRGAKLWHIDVSHFKAQIYRQLFLDYPQPGEPFPRGYIHLPAGVIGSGLGVSEEWLKQLVSENLIMEVNKKNGDEDYTWFKTRRRNEALDNAVYARAAAHVYGLPRWSEDRWITELEGLNPPPPTAMRTVETEPKPTAPRSRNPFAGFKSRVMTSGDPDLV